MNNAIPELADNAQAVKKEKSKAEELKAEDLQNDPVILSNQMIKQEEERVPSSL